MVNCIGNIRNKDKRSDDVVVDSKPIVVTRGLLGFAYSVSPDNSNRPLGQHNNSSQLPIEPRLVSQKLAAEYCGMKTDTFRKYCRNGLLPGPVKHMGNRWDLRAIDALLDELSNIGVKNQDEFEIWKMNIGENNYGI